MVTEADTSVVYEAHAAEFEIARELIAPRNRAKLTRAEVAQRNGTTQSAIAHLERGHAQSPIRSVQRYAQAIGHRARARLKSDWQHAFQSPETALGCAAMADRNKHCP